MPPFCRKLICVALLAAVIGGLRSHTAAQDKQQPDGNQPEKDEPPVLLQPPESAEEFFRAAVLMHRLARPELARKYLEGLMKLKPDEATLLKLRDKFGPSDFLRLARAKELQPLSQQLLQRVNAAVRQRNADPKHIDALLDDLQGDPAERKAAQVMLQNIGPGVIPRILQRTARVQNAQQLSVLESALIDFGPSAVRPLIAALEAPNRRIQTVALTALGYIGVNTSAPHIWHLAFDPDEAAGVRTAARRALARIFKTDINNIRQATPASVSAELKRLAITHFRREHDWKTVTLEDTTGNLQQPGGNNTINFWYWDQQNDTLRQQQVTPRFASMYVGTRFSRQALKLSAENHETQVLFVAMSLAAAADPNWERPLPTGKGTAFHAALTSGPDVVQDALQFSMKHGNADAAIGCLLVLRELATKNSLRNPSGEPPIVQALNYPDERVQFAAAVTVLNIDPDRSFRGISRVVPILARALNDSGSSTAVVIDPNVQRASTLSGLLSGMGFQARLMNTGRDGFRHATTHSDVELVMVHVNSIRWELTQTLANLRADSRSAHIPIAIYGPESIRSRVRRLLRRHPRTGYVVESSTNEHLTLQLRPFLASMRSAPMSAEQRTQQRRAAAFWLAHIAAGKRTELYSLSAAETPLVNSVTDPDIGENVVQALSSIGSKTAQQTLQSVVVNPNRQPAVRITAATRLAVHIQNYGLMLTDQRIGELKQLHAATNNPDLTTALGSMLGTLKPDAQRVGNQLLQLPPPNIPPSSSSGKSPGSSSGNSPSLPIPN